jgi:nucleolar protein 15
MRFAQGGKGGLKKQKAPKVGSKKRPALVAAEEPAEEPQAKRAASAPSTGDSLPAFEPLGATHTDYSEGEGEGEEPAPMQLLDESTTQAVKREVRKTQRPSGGVRPTPPGAGVLYLGHVPHGFYEEQMRGFFSQFGAVTRLRLARNKKTGRSKHYAFVEFKHRDVCEIVAKAMNGYLIYSKVLVAKVMEPQQVRHARRFFPLHV